MGKIEIIKSLINDLPCLSNPTKIDAMASKDLEITLIGLTELNKNSSAIDMEKVMSLGSCSLRGLMASLNKLRNDSYLGPGADLRLP